MSDLSAAITKISCRPGDVLIAYVDPTLPEYKVHALAESMHAALNVWGVKVCVLTNGVTIKQFRDGNEIELASGEIVSLR